MTRTKSHTWTILAVINWRGGVLTAKQREQCQPYFGVELSDVCKTECSTLAHQGKVFSTVGLCTLNQVDP